MSMPVEGRRGSVRSADGSTIGFVTAGSGPPLLLVHGGMNSSLRWAPLWPLLVNRFTVTAMDRRGRGMSAVEGSEYALEREYEDVLAVAAALEGETPPLVFGHSIGAVAVLGAAALGAPMRRVVLYEPPGPPTVPAEWIDRVTGYLAAGQTGRAMVSFLREVVGLSDETIAELRDTPAASDVLPIVEATMVREAHALARVDIDALAARLAARLPDDRSIGSSADAARVVLLLGTQSPSWAAEITGTVQQALPGSELLRLDGHGHEAVDTAPATVAAILVRALQAAPR